MIVSNTTPISNFLHLGEIDVLTAICKKVHIPDFVKREIEVLFEDDEQWKRCMHDGSILVHDIENKALAKQLARTLHAGEM